MKADSAVKTPERTRRQNLVRHKSGLYYARLYLNGKEIWKSFKTSHYSVAEARLARTVKKHREMEGRTGVSANAKMTFVDAAQLHMQRLDETVNNKRRTRTYWREILAALLKSWPTLSEAEIRKVTASACREWATRYAKFASATRFNGTISLPRHEVATESGVIYSNPARAVDRKPVRAKKLELPTRSQLSRHDESGTRAANIAKHERKSEGNLSPHTDHRGVWVFAPVKDSLPRKSGSPCSMRVQHGEARIITLYKNALGVECPFIVSKDEASSCGSSSTHFGCCWTCIVVEKDNSIESLISAGHQDLLPLADFRNRLKTVSENPE